LETLLAVVAVFVEAYNRFGLAKQHFRKHRPKGEVPFGLVKFF
jgi:ribosomal protein S14